ncbi:hypothetical protein L6227_15035 [Pseudomonas syringae pv. syringae]|uniref:hypothetical protein n=1 Tax=Pseudomonas syringae TaxID=317 RepID=UPI001F108C89|nr:hypothetical protein [Pseudomonas syringae]MCH5550593.1 hypothetical protein [Pseudomonas syringae pv. syringae]
MNDLENQLCRYMQIADMLTRMKETVLVEDPAVVAQLKELRVAMAELNAMIDRLQQAADLHSAANRRPRPRMYVVKRSSDTPSGIGK